MLKRPKSEEIVVKFRRVEFLTGQAMPRLDAIRQIGATNTHSIVGVQAGKKSVQWTVFTPNKCGGMGIEQLKELKRIQKENARLRRAVSDLTPDNLILSQVARGTTDDPWRPSRTRLISIACLDLLQILRAEDFSHNTCPCV